jgi:phage nucleotide-binding protein
MRSKAVDELPTKKPSELVGANSWVIYGRSGTGKTTFAGSFPKPILLLDCKDEGSSSLLGMDDIEVMRVESTDDLEMVHEFLNRHPDRYKTVVLDTVSMLQQIVTEETGDKKKKVSTKAAGAWGTLTRQDWGDIAAYMKTWLVNFRDLSREHGMEVVFIAQDRVNNFEDADTEDGAIAPEVGPRLSPSIASALNAAVSIIGNTFIRVRDVTVTNAKTGKKTKRQKIEYALRIGPNSSYITKARKGKSITLPEFIDDPDYESVLEALAGE